MEPEQTDLFPAPPATHVYALPGDGAVLRRCKSCGAPIVWGFTPRGASVPLSLLTIERINGQYMATSHFRDCPHASGWGGGRA